MLFENAFAKHFRRWRTLWMVFGTIKFSFVCQLFVSHLPVKLTKSSRRLKQTWRVCLWMFRDSDFVLCTFSADSWTENKGERSRSTSPAPSVSFSGKFSKLLPMLKFAVNGELYPPTLLWVSLVLMLSFEVYLYNRCQVPSFTRKYINQKGIVFFIASFTFVRCWFCIVEFSSVRIEW